MACLGKLFGLLCFFHTSVCVAIEPIKLQLNFQYDSERSFSGIDGFNFTRINTRLSLPLLYRVSGNGYFLVGGSLTENRFAITGDNASTRRLYRFSLPFQFFAKQVGRWQHSWLLEPALFSDESIFKQKRSSIEYGWQAAYSKTSKARFVMGIQRDNRFGVDAYYPVFGLDSRPNSRWHHHWVFPDVYSQIQLSRQSTLRLFAQPEGGGWRYKQLDGSVASLSMHFWKVGANFQKTLPAKLQVDVAVGLQLSSESSVAGVKGDLSSGYFILFQLQKLFLR